MKVAIIVAVVFAIIAHGDAKVSFKIQNLSGRELWIGIQGSIGKEDLADGGFSLKVNGYKIVYADDKWAGIFWARTYCNNNGDHCRKLDCGNKIQCALPGDASGTIVRPATYISVHLKYLKDNSDTYVVTTAHGHNVVTSIEPVNGQGDGGQYSCTKAQDNAQQKDKKSGKLHTCKANTYKIDFAREY